MRTLDRYILMKFCIPFMYCMLGFISIWLVFDLRDSGPDFIAAKTPLSEVVQFYFTQVPEIIVISLPISALLALLYSLTQMSRSNEIVAMLTAGVSIKRIIIPFAVIGVILSGISMYFNYEQAPHAQALKKLKLREIQKGKKIEPGLTGHLFRNRENLRSWFMRKIFRDRQMLEDVMVIQQNDQGGITDILYAKQAYYTQATHTWTFFDAKYVHHDESGEIIGTPTVERKIEVSDWSETPWRIASSVMNPDYLSVDELKAYLTFNSDFPARRLAPYRTHLYYRWSLPWMCLLVVFIAAPLGIVYSRRGILGGVSAAIFIFFSLIFFSSLFLTLGKGAKVDPFIATWGLVIFYFIIGFVLLWFKSTNRELPKLPGL